MQIIYQEVVTIRARKVLVYCPRHQPLNLLQHLVYPLSPPEQKIIWIAQIQTQKIVERCHNLDLIKSHFFTEVTSFADAEE